VHSFEYAILRVVPKVEREEFLNVGVILYCKAHKFLQVKISIDERKLRVLSDGIDVEDIKSYLHAFEEITKGLNVDSPISRLDPPSRFRWLTATRSTVLQTSRVHPGICDDPNETLEKLFMQYVL
jgi:hypothetical protein